MGDIGFTIAKITVFVFLLICFGYMFFGETKRLKRLAKELAKDYEIDLKYTEQLIQAAKQSMSGSLNPYVKVGNTTVNYHTGKIAVIDCKWGPFVDWKDSEKDWEDIDLFWEVRDRIRKMK